MAVYSCSLSVRCVLYQKISFWGGLRVFPSNFENFQKTPFLGAYVKSCALDKYWTKKIGFLFLHFRVWRFFLDFWTFFSLLGYDTTLHIRGRRKNVQTDLEILEKKVGHKKGEFLWNFRPKKVHISETFFGLKYHETDPRPTKSPVLESIE